jgi:hypothetical protein
MVEKSPFSSGTKPKEIQVCLDQQYSGIKEQKVSLPYKTKDLGNINFLCILINKVLLNLYFGINRK